MQGTGVAGVREGDVLAGKYRIDRILGVGGMGAVVAAHHVLLDDKVAIKFLLPEMLESTEAVARFAREARAAVKIKNEHVARVTDVGTLENGAPYMVMEYLDGSDLAAMIRKQGPLQIEQTVEFVLQACEAIAEAHGLGIVHRDLKPANLFCVRRTDGQLAIKVLDFGISKVTSPVGSGPEMGMTSTAAVMGSPLYMSPEQMQSTREVDHRTDIWALGVILFELLTGEVPFRGATMPEVCVKIATQAPPPLRTSRPEAPAALEQVIVRCLEKDAKRRYRTVGELANALLPFGPVRARTSVERIAGFMQGPGTWSADEFISALPPDEPGAGLTEATWGQTASATKRGGRWVVVLTAVLSVLAIAGAMFFWMRTADPPRTAVAAELSTALPIAAPSPVAAPLQPENAPTRPETTPSAPETTTGPAETEPRSSPPPSSRPKTASSADAVPKLGASPPVRPVKAPTPIVAKHGETAAPRPTASVPLPAPPTDLGGRL